MRLPGVASDAGSIYEPYPMLAYQWDPDAPAILPPSPQQDGSHFNLGPHPADPNASALPSPTSTHANGFPSPNAQVQHVPGHEVWVYGGNEGSLKLVFIYLYLPNMLVSRTYTFWRFSIQIPLGPSEMLVKYSINHGQELNFYVPGRNQNMRWATYSVSSHSECWIIAADYHKV